MHTAREKFENAALILRVGLPSTLISVTKKELFKNAFTITAEIHARSLANLYCQYADRHMNLKFMRRDSEREPAIRQFALVRKQIDVSFFMLLSCY